MTRPCRLNQSVRDHAATPSSWRRVDGVEVDATIQDAPRNFDFHTDEHARDGGDDRGNADPHDLRGGGREDHLRRGAFLFANA